MLLIFFSLFHCFFCRFILCFFGYFFYLFCSCCLCLHSVYSNNILDSALADFFPHQNLAGTMHHFHYYCYAMFPFFFDNGVFLKESMSVSEWEAFDFPHSHSDPLRLPASLIRWHRYQFWELRLLPNRLSYIWAEKNIPNSENCISEIARNFGLIKENYS